MGNLEKFTSPKIRNASYRVGNAYNHDGIIPAGFETLTRGLGKLLGNLEKFTSPKIRNASYRVGNAYNHDGIVPSRLDTFQQDLKRFQEGWKYFWVIFETNSQVRKWEMLPTGLETNPIGLEMLHFHRRFGNGYNHDGIVPIMLESYPISSYQSVGIYPTTLLLRWDTIQDESVQLLWNLSYYIGICPTMLESFKLYSCFTNLDFLQLTTAIELTIF